MSIAFADYKKACTPYYVSATKLSL